MVPEAPPRAQPPRLSSPRRVLSEVGTFHQDDTTDWALGGPTVGGSFKDLM